MIVCSSLCVVRNEYVIDRQVMRYHSLYYNTMNEWLINYWYFYLSSSIEWMWFLPLTNLNVNPSPVLWCFKLNTCTRRTELCLKGGRMWGVHRISLWLWKLSGSAEWRFVWDFGTECISALFATVVTFSILYSSLPSMPSSDS